MKSAEFIPMVDEWERKEIICRMINATEPAERERHRQQLEALDADIDRRMAAQQALDELERERARGSEQEQPAPPDQPDEQREHILTP